MKPENHRLIAEQLKLAAEALNRIALLLCTSAEAEGQPELPITTTTVTVTPPSLTDPVPAKANPAPEITRQSLRTLAEKLVANGRLHLVKEALAEFGVATLSALKPENYAEVYNVFIGDLGE